MIPTEQLRELQAEFEPARIDKQRSLKELEKLRRDFVKLFPRSRIPQLTLDEFVQGKRNKESFCYWVEIKTKDLGHIQGATSKKFGIYYSKEKGASQFTKKYKSVDDARIRILKAIEDLVIAGENSNIEAISNSAISPMFKGKILSLYFPERFVNIFSERHVDYFLSQLRINDPGAKIDLIAKKERLTEFKNGDEVMKDWTTYEFTAFLYWAWRPPPRDEKKVPASLKDYVLIFPAPEETDPEFITLQVGDTDQLPEPGIVGNIGPTDFEKRNRRNKLTGNQGEDVVLMAEKRELTRRGRLDLAKRVKAVCRESDGVGAGYDILSFEFDGREKQIEVKSTISKAPAPGGSFQFHLSTNEYEQAQQPGNFHIYIVFDVKSKKPKIWPIPNPANLVPERLRLKPSAYYATLTIA